MTLEELDEIENYCKALLQEDPRSTFLKGILRVLEEFASARKHIEDLSDGTEIARVNTENDELRYTVSWLEDKVQKLSVEQEALYARLRDFTSGFNHEPVDRWKEEGRERERYGDLDRLYSNQPLPLKFKGF